MQPTDENGCFVGSPFLFDIFLSYSHGKMNESGDSDFLLWSKRFHFELLRVIRDLDDSGEMEQLKIFFDESPRPEVSLSVGNDVDTVLEANASASAFLIALISPGYLNSSYCKNERKWWHEGQANLSFETKDRFLPLLIWGRPPTPDSTWEAALRRHDFPNVINACFFDSATAFNRPHPFGWPGLERNQKMIDEVVEVATPLFLRLRKFRDLVRQKQALSQPIIPENPTVYLHAREDLSDAFDAAHEALSDRGFIVLPETPERIEIDPTKRAKIRDLRTEQLKESNALVLVATEDESNFHADLKVWKQDRGLPVAQGEKNSGVPRRLPAAVLDTVEDATLAKRRRAIVRNQGLGWFHLPEPDWADQAAQWIKEAP